VDGSEEEQLVTRAAGSGRDEAFSFHSSVPVESSTVFAQKSICSIADFRLLSDRNANT
jgi:hypothetical protein